MRGQERQEGVLTYLARTLVALPSFPPFAAPASLSFELFQAPSSEQSGRRRRLFSVPALRERRPAAPPLGLYLIVSPNYERARSPPLAVRFVVGFRIFRRANVHDRVCVHVLSIKLAFRDGRSVPPPRPSTLFIKPSAVLHCFATIQQRCVFCSD